MATVQYAGLRESSNQHSSCCALTEPALIRMSVCDLLRCFFAVWWRALKISGRLRMEFRTGSIDFSAPLRGSGPRVASQTVVFPRPIVHAVAGLGGYTVAFSGDDHHVGRIEVRLDASINANTVTVEARLGLRDWSGNWDDDYNGTVEFALLADLESVTATPPRPDLIVTGMEFNQAVQFFRAATYLDPAHVQPDNSIWLVARKDTGVRVYTDWDPSAGLAAISRLTGTLTVQTSSTTLTLNPINPGGSITPLRDAQINMAIADHTLNFMIPAAWCVGTVTATCELWDLASPGSKSARYTRTIVFTPVDPLNLYLVGINYQAVAPQYPGTDTVRHLWNDPQSDQDLSSWRRHTNGLQHTQLQRIGDW